MRARSLYRTPASFRVAADWVTFECDGERVHGYLGAPQGCMLFGAVVAAPGEAGVGGHLQERTRRLGAEGFVTLTIDLFGRAGAGGDMEAVRVLQAGFDYLSRRLDVDADCIGALGYGRGGDAVLACCRAQNKLACAVAFRPLPETKFAVARRSGAACPVQLHYWEEDAEIPFDDAVAFKQNLERDRERLIEFHAYPGARCSDLDFAGETNGCGLAARRMTGFFHRYLGDWTTA